MNLYTIVLDCDDVLLDWIGGFRDWSSVHLGRTIEGLPDDWHMENWLGVTEDVCVEMIREHNAGDSFGDLKAVPGAKETIDRWSSIYNLHVVTSCSSDPVTVKMRKDNLRREFGDVFESIHCLDLGQPKDKLLQAFRPGSAWIEDNYKNAMLGASVGLVPYMRERPHNKQFRELKDDVMWFKDWSDLQGTI